MSISYTKLESRVLLHNQLSYDAIVRVGSSCQAGWKIEDVEPDAIFDGFRGELFLEPRASTDLERELAVLDRTFPFLRFGEEGRHFAYELFLSPPDYWGSRGAPFFWAYAARQFTFDELPMPKAKLERKYRAIVDALGISFGVGDYFYVEQFARGGMSSGMVGGRFVKDGLKILKKRLELYR